MRLASWDMCGPSSKTAWQLKEHLAVQRRAARETVLFETRYRVVASTAQLEKLYALTKIKCACITYVCVGNSYPYHHRCIIRFCMNMKVLQGRIQIVNVWEQLGLVKHIKLQEWSKWTVYDIIFHWGLTLKLYIIYIISKVCNKNNVISVILM